MCVSVRCVALTEAAYELVTNVLWRLADELAANTLPEDIDMEWKSMAEKCEKYIAYTMVVLMIGTLLPIMYLGRYNHPTGDDYYYGAETKLVWEATDSVMQTLAEAVRGVVYQYHNWQGTYSAMLLMYIPPNIFGQWAYRFVTSAIILLLVGGIFYLMRTIICHVLKGTGKLWLMVSSLLTLLCIQTVPFPGESFFWYNGSMYYTGYFAVTLFFCGAVVRYMVKPQKYRIPVMCFLAVFLGGGNYVSLLPTLLFMLMLTMVLVWKRAAGARGIGAVTLFFLICFCVNVLAPGNHVRKDGMWSIPAWKAILKSLLQGGRYSVAWTGGWLILALLIMTPFLWRGFAEIDFRFRYPLLAVGIFFGMFCSMSTPVFYTMNSTGPVRVVDIVYYGFLLFVFWGYYYVLGYCYRLVERRTRLSLPRGVGRGLVVFVLLLGTMQIVGGAVGKTTIGKTVELLASGSAAAYEREYQERRRILEDETVRDVVFKPYENQPDMLYVGDFAGDVQDETNQKTAQYFHKNTLCVAY